MPIWVPLSWVPGPRVPGPQSQILGSTEYCIPTFAIVLYIYICPSIFYCLFYILTFLAWAQWATPSPLSPGVIHRVMLGYFSLSISLSSFQWHCWWYYVTLYTVCTCMTVSKLWAWLIAISPGCSLPMAAVITLVCESTSTTGVQKFNNEVLHGMLVGAASSQLRNYIIACPFFNCQTKVPLEIRTVWQVLRVKFAILLVGSIKKLPICHLHHQCHQFHHHLQCHPHFHLH